MDTLHIAKTALRTLFDHKRLWLFGFFVAAGTGASYNYSGDGDWPVWAIALLIAVLVLGFAGAFLHVLSESALIKAVKDTWAGSDVQLAPSMRLGLRRFLPVLGIKVLVALANLLSLAVVAAPAVLGALSVVPLWLGISLTTLLAIPSVPWMLTIHFVYEWALRFAVLENLGATGSLRAASRFLRGRIAPSLRLLLVTALANLTSMVLLLAVILPAAALGIGIYSFAGLLPAAISAGVFVLPFAALIVGATGTYRSSLWTLGFLEEHGGFGDGGLERLA